MIRRRDFLALTGAATLAAPLRALAQAPQVKRLGFIFTLAQNDPETPLYVSAFRSGLAAEGRSEGGNLVIDYRWGVNTPALARAAATDVLSLKPDVMLAVSTALVREAAKLTHTVPIVFALVADPIGEGFVESFTHPGGNLTGFTQIGPEAAGKWFDLLHEIVPTAKRVGFLFDGVTAATYLTPLQTAANTIGIEAVGVLAATPDAIQPAVAEFATRPDAALIVGPSTLLVTNHSIVTAAVTAARIPAVYGHVLYGDSGLANFYIDSHEVVGQAAGYAGLILNGAKPAELPVQTPTRFTLILNQRTANALGITIPKTILVFADQVVE